MIHTRALRGAVAVWLLLSSAAFLDLDENDFRCENLAAKLEECCSEVESTELYCDYGGCGSPDISARELGCLEEMSCGEIVERGVCERVLERDSFSAFDGADDEVATGNEERSLCE